jgi:LCP family protein required for cell wall assembly
MSTTQDTVSPQPEHRSSRLFSTRKRRAGFVLASLLVVVLTVAGVQGWRVVTAIMKVEQAAVVPLPASPRFDPEGSSENGHAPSTAGLLADSGRSSSQLNPSVDSNTSHEQPGDSDDGQDANRAGNAGNPPEDEQYESPSRLEVAQSLVEASMANGDPGLSDVWEDRESLNILVLGVDRRPEGGDQNADVIVIAQLDLVSHTLTGVSIPRDLLVNIPGAGEGKINESYNQGVLDSPEDPVAGVARVRDTVESTFGVRIDGYVLVDFSGFEEIVDALGGIEVEVPYVIVDNEYPTEDYGTEEIRFEPGVQHMNGEQALKYVRTRNADSDDARRERQIDVIVSILQQGKSFSSIANADELIVTAGDAIQTSFTLEEQLTLARLARMMTPEQVSIVTLEEPLLTSGWTDAGQWVYTADPDQLRQFVQQSLESEPEAGSSAGS